MTENKRFKNVEENLEWGTVQYFTYYDEKITDKELEKLVNHLLNQNDELNDENQKLDEKICSLTRDLIKTKSYEQLEKELNRIKNKNEGLKSENEDMRRLINNISHQRDEFHHGARENANRVGKLKKENEQLKQRIKSRLHYYRELCNEFDKDDGFNYNIVKRIVEDLEDILK